MSIKAELITLFNDDQSLNHILESIEQKLDYHSQCPIHVQLLSEVFQKLANTSSYYIESQLILTEGRCLPISTLDSCLSQRLLNQISLYSLEIALRELRERQSNVPVVLPITTVQLSDYIFIQKLIALILQNRFSFRNLKLEIKIGVKLPSNILALQRGYRLASSCGIQLGILGFDVSTRLLCGLIHFNYIKLDGNKLYACHLDRKKQSQLSSLHHMAVDLGIRLICSNLTGAEELDWLRNADYFQEKDSQVLSQHLAQESDLTNNYCQSANIQQFRPAAFA